MTFKTANTVD